MQETFSRCRELMMREQCIIQLDATHYKPGETMQIPGVGHVPMQAYIEIRNAADTMCEFAEQKCIGEGSAAHCAIAQGAWGRPDIDDSPTSAMDPATAAAVALSVLAAGAVAAVASRLRKPQVA